MHKKIIACFFLILSIVSMNGQEKDGSLDLILKINVASGYLFPLDENTRNQVLDTSGGSLNLKTGIQVENLFMENLILGVSARQAVDWQHIGLEAGYSVDLVDYISWVPAFGVGVGQHQDQNYFTSFNPYLNTYFEFELPWGFLIDAGAYINVEFTNDEIYYYWAPYIGIGLIVYPRKEGTVTTSLPVLEVEDTGVSSSGESLELLEFTVSKPTEQPYIKCKNLADSTVEVLSAEIVFKEKYIKPVSLKVATKTAAGEVVSLTILDKLTDDIFQLNRGKVVSASVQVKYKGNGKTFNKTLPIEISFKLEILKSFVQPKINEAQQNINWYGATEANQNKLGVVYARYGLYDEAMNVFSNIVATSEYVPSLMNLGSIYMVKNDYFRVLPFLERARNKDPYNTKILIALAKAQMSVENFGSAKSIYYTLEALNPVLAKEYSWFKLTGDAAREAAESSNMKNIIVWVE